MSIEVEPEDYAKIILVGAIVVVIFFMILNFLPHESRTNAYGWTDIQIKTRTSELLQSNYQINIKPDQISIKSRTYHTVNNVSCELVDLGTPQFTISINFYKDNLATVEIFHWI